MVVALGVLVLVLVLVVVVVVGLRAAAALVIAGPVVRQAQGPAVALALVPVDLLVVDRAVQGVVQELRVLGQHLQAAAADSEVPTIVPASVPVVVAGVAAVAVAVDAALHRIHKET